MAETSMAEPAENRIEALLRYCKTQYNQSFVLNGVIFQAIWWLAILLGNQATPIVAVLLGLHFLLISNIKREALFVLLIAVPGALVDSLATALGLFVFPADQFFLGAIPLWLWCIWFGYGASIRLSLLPIIKRFSFIKILFPFLATLSYVAAEGMGVVQFGFSTGFAIASLVGMWILWLGWLLFLDMKLCNRQAS